MRWSVIAWKREERAFQPWMPRQRASAIMQSWQQVVSTWLRPWYEVIVSDSLPGYPMLPRPPWNDTTSFMKRYPPSSSAATARCVRPAFPGDSGSNMLQDTGYSLTSRLASRYRRLSAVSQSPGYSSHPGGRNLRCRPGTALWVTDNIVTHGAAHPCVTLFPCFVTLRRSHARYSMITAFITGSANFSFCNRYTWIYGIDR